jgi:pimeloyl-ACP methyl ester carboxylesterase
MHYVTSGPADGEPVVLLHGFPEYWYCWQFQIPALADAAYRVIVPDQRGYNLTDKQGPYTLATLTEDLRQFLDALGIEQCNLVAHDFGAPPAYTFAWLYPSRVKNLVVINGPHPNAFLDALWSHPSQVLRSWYIFFFQIPVLPEFLFRADHFGGLQAAFKDLSLKAMNSEDFDCFQKAFEQPGALKAAIGWYRASMRRFLKGKPARRDIQVPTLIIWGMQDRELGKYVNETLEKYVSDLHIQPIEDAGHFVQMEDPDQVNEILLDCLRH